jgi:hypothetical protein
MTHESSSARWWLLLLPLGYLLHLAEEWWCGEGFVAWTARAVGTGVSPTRFLIVNSIIWPLSAVLTVLALKRPALAWFPTTFATVVVINAIVHALGTLATSVYSPGLITGLAIYLPVGGRVLLSGRRELSSRAFTFAALLGVLVHAAVMVIAFA